MESNGLEKQRVFKRSYGAGTKTIRTMARKVGNGGVYLSTTRRKLQSLEKELKKITSGHMEGIFFVEWDGEERIIRGSAPNNQVVFQGKEEEYQQFIGKYKETIFIIDDIPRDIYGGGLVDWAK